MTNRKHQHHPPGLSGEALVVQATAVAPGPITSLHPGSRCRREADRCPFGDPGTKPSTARRPGKSHTTAITTDADTPTSSTDVNTAIGRQGDLPLGGRSLLRKKWGSLSHVVTCNTLQARALARRLQLVGSLGTQLLQKMPPQRAKCELSGCKRSLPVP